MQPPNTRAPLRALAALAVAKSASAVRHSACSAALAPVPAPHIHGCSTTATASAATQGNTRWERGRRRSGQLQQGGKETLLVQQGRHMMARAVLHHLRIIWGESILHQACAPLSSSTCGRMLAR